MDEDFLCDDCLTGFLNGVLLTAIVFIIIISNIRWANMKIEIRRYKDEILGVDLIAEDGIEQDIVQHFWKEGIKINGIINNSETLRLTFKDLIGKE